MENNYLANAADYCVIVGLITFIVLVWFFIKYTYEKHLLQKQSRIKKNVSEANKFLRNQSKNK